MRQLDRPLALRAIGALAMAGARYWLSVAPHVQRQLSRYTVHARSIQNPALRATALERLNEQALATHGATVLATLVPLPKRAAAIQVITALATIYDYLDALTESPAQDPLRRGRHLYQAIFDAIEIDRRPVDDYYQSPCESTTDNGYLRALVQDTRNGLALLPSLHIVAPLAVRSAHRLSEAQIRTHAVPQLGNAQLEKWATNQARGSTLPWADYLAGAASSIFSIHALVAAAAHATITTEDAESLELTYFHFGLVLTLLDSLIDYHDDLRSTGEPGYVRYYPNLQQLAHSLRSAVRETIKYARRTPNPGHHTMMLAGIVTFHTTGPRAEQEPARAQIALLQQQLQPLTTPTSAVVRARRWSSPVSASVRST